MSVAQPQILHVLNGTSGTTVTNFGTVATNGSVGQGTENTHWSWNPAGSPFAYWRAITGVGTANQPWISDLAIAMPTSLQSVWGAIGFQLASFDTATNSAYLYGRNIGGTTPSGLTFKAVPPTATNNFNLECRITTTGAGERTHIFENLIFGTDYQAVISADTTVSTAVVGKAALNAGAVQTISGTSNFNGEAFSPDGGWIGRGADFTEYRGFTGRVYYFAEGRGTLLSDADILAINSNPSGTITGWPGGGSTPTNQIPTVLSQRNRRHTGRYS